MAWKPPPTLPVSDLGEDSHTSQGTPKAPSLLGSWPQKIQIPTPSPTLWNHFRHTVQLLTTLGSQASGSDGSGCQLFKWGKTKPKLRPFPGNSHLKGLSQVRGRTFTDTVVEGISMLKSAGICPVSISSDRAVGQVAPQGFSSLDSPLCPDPRASLAAHLLFTVLPPLSQSPLPPKVSQLSIHTDDKNTASYRTGRVLSRSDSQGCKGQSYHTRAHEHTQPQQELVLFWKPALLDQPRTEEACVPPNTPAGLNDDARESVHQAHQSPWLFSKLLQSAKATNQLGVI